LKVGRLIVCLLLALGVSLSAQGGEIHNAVTKGNLNKVGTLLNDHPELLESKDNLGRTPLYLAVAHNQLEIAELLLANGADVNARDPQLHTPLIQAIWVYNHDKMMRLLLAKGAGVNLSDKWNMTALAYAAKQGQPGDARILIANDANINFVMGDTPLYFAVIGTHTEMVELLLANGAEVNHKVRGFTVLHFARQENYLTNQISDPKIEALIKKYGGHE
jgi:ankyrin repeat protein